MEAFVSIMKASLKQMHLQDQKRESREKKKHQYWQEDIFNKKHTFSHSESACGEGTVYDVDFSLK